MITFLTIDELKSRKYFIRKVVREIYSRNPSQEEVLEKIEEYFNKRFLLDQNIEFYEIPISIKEFERMHKELKHVVPKFGPRINQKAKKVIDFLFKLPVEPLSNSLIYNGKPLLVSDIQKRFKLSKESTNDIILEIINQSKGLIKVDNFIIKRRLNEREFLVKNRIRRMLEDPISISKADIASSLAGIFAKGDRGNAGSTQVTNKQKRQKNTKTPKGGDE